MSAPEWSNEGRPMAVTMALRRAISFYNRARALLEIQIANTRGEEKQVWRKVRAEVAQAEDPLNAAFYAVDLGMVEARGVSLIEEVEEVVRKAALANLRPEDILSTKKVKHPENRGLKGTYSDKYPRRWRFDSSGRGFEIDNGDDPGGGGGVKV